MSESGELTFVRRAIAPAAPPRPPSPVCTPTQTAMYRLFETYLRGYCDPDADALCTNSEITARFSPRGTDQVAPPPPPQSSETPWLWVTHGNESSHIVTVLDRLVDLWLTDGGPLAYAESAFLEHLTRKPPPPPSEKVRKARWRAFAPRNDVFLQDYATAWVRRLVATALYHYGLAWIVKLWGNRKHGADVGADNVRAMLMWGGYAGAIQNPADISPGTCHDVGLLIVERSLRSENWVGMFSNRQTPSMVQDVFALVRPVVEKKLLSDHTWSPSGHAAKQIGTDIATYLRTERSLPTWLERKERRDTDVFFNESWFSSIPRVRPSDTFPLSQ